MSGVSSEVINFKVCLSEYLRCALKKKGVVGQTKIGLFSIKKPSFGNVVLLFLLKWFA